MYSFQFIIITQFFFLKKANYDIFPLTVIKQFYNTEDRGGEQQKSN